MQPNVFFSGVIREHSENHLTKFLKQSELGLKFFLGMWYVALMINLCKDIQTNLDPPRR